MINISILQLKVSLLFSVTAEHQHPLFISS